MRILIINFEYPPLGGGGGVATAEIAQELSKRHEVHVITSRVPTSLGAGEERDGKGVQVHRVAVWGRKDLSTASMLSMITFVPSAWWRAMGLTRRTKFDVVNAQFVVPSGIPGSMVAKTRSIPFVLSFIGGDVFDPSKGISPHRHWLLRLIVRVIARQADVCTAISNDTKRRTVQWHKVKKEIVVTHLGIHPQHTGQKSRGELGLPEDKPVFATVGRLIPRKGYEVMIRAWADIEDAHLVVMGSGPQLESLQNLAVKLGVADRVHWFGFVDDEKKINVLDRSDGYVSATEHEGFGIVFLEAMESGLPIVSTWEGGQTDFLRADHNAILVRPGDKDGLARGVRQMLENDDLRSRMSETNRNEVKKYYWPNVVREFEQVLMGVKEKL